MNCPLRGRGQGRVTHWKLKGQVRKNAEIVFLAVTPLQTVWFAKRKDQNVPRPSVSLSPSYIYVVKVKVKDKGQGRGCDNPKIVFRGNFASTVQTRMFRFRGMCACCASHCRFCILVLYLLNITSFMHILLNSTVACIHTLGLGIVFIINPPRMHVTVLRSICIVNRYEWLCATFSWYNDVDKCIIHKRVQKHTLWLRCPTVHDAQYCVSTKKQIQILFSMASSNCS